MANGQFEGPLLGSTVAEEALIAAVLRDPECIHDIGEITNSADFSSPENRVIFSAMESLASRGQPIDPVTVWETFQHDGHADACRDQLFSIAADPLGSGFPAAYAQAVYNRARERELIVAAGDIAGIAYGDGELNEKIAAAQDAIMRIGETHAEGLVYSNQALKEWLDQIETKHQRSGGLTGLATGYANIDARLHGLQSTDLIIVGARPSQGKTTYALNIAEHVAVNLRQPVLVFSLEMGVNQLYDKLGASVGSIPLSRIRRGDLVDGDWDRLSAAVRKIKDSPLYIDGRPALHISQIQATARRLHRKAGLSLVIVDYIQLARGDGQNRENEIASISRGLKALAKSLGIPVVALSQLSRKCEERVDKRPIMSDLRDSGGIEQDADIIQFLYRDEYYHEASNRAGIAEIHTAKFRNGEVGTDYLTSRLDISRFEDYAGIVPTVAEPRRKSRGFNG